MSNFVDNMIREAEDARRGRIKAEDRRIDRLKGSLEAHADKLAREVGILLERVQASDLPPGLHRYLTEALADYRATDAALTAAYERLFDLYGVEESR